MGVGVVLLNSGISQTTFYWTCLTTLLRLTVVPLTGSLHSWWVFSGASLGLQSIPPGALGSLSHRFVPDWTLTEDLCPPAPQHFGGSHRWGKSGEWPGCASVPESEETIDPKTQRTSGGNAAKRYAHAHLSFSSTTAKMSWYFPAVKCFQSPQSSLSSKHVFWTVKEMHRLDQSTRTLPGFSSPRPGQILSPHAWGHTDEPGHGMQISQNIFCCQSFLSSSLTSNCSCPGRKPFHRSCIWEASFFRFKVQMSFIAPDKKKITDKREGRDVMGRPNWNKEEEDGKCRQWHTYSPFPSSVPTFPSLTIP